MYWLSINQLSIFWLLVIWWTWILFECILTWYAWDNWGLHIYECIGLGAHASWTLVLVLLWSSVFIVANKTHTHLTQCILISGHLTYIVWTWYASYDLRRVTFQRHLLNLNFDIRVIKFPTIFLVLLARIELYFIFSFWCKSLGKFQRSWQIFKWRTSTLHWHKEGKIKWPVMTLTFEIWSPKETCSIPGVCVTFASKIKLIPPSVFEDFGQERVYDWIQEHKHYCFNDII